MDHNQVNCAADHDHSRDSEYPGPDYVLCGNPLDRLDAAGETGAYYGAGDGMGRTYGNTEHRSENKGDGSGRLGAESIFKYSSFELLIVSSYAYPVKA